MLTISGFIPYIVRFSGLAVKCACIAASSKYGVMTTLSPFGLEVRAPRAYRAFGLMSSSVDSVPPAGIVTDVGKASS